ncbi:DUF5915 domain-containing protein, partial [Clostridium cochlearium]
GQLREILSKIQNMRKEKEFEVADRIKLYISGNEALEKVVKKFEDIIRKETIAEEVLYNKDIEYVDCKINGEDFKIQVEVIK